MTQLSRYGFVSSNDKFMQLEIKKKTLIAKHLHFIDYQTWILHKLSCECCETHQKNFGQKFQFYCFETQ